LPKRFGRWHGVYSRMRREARSGVLDRVFTALQEEEIALGRVEALGPNSTIVDGTGADRRRAAVHRAPARGPKHQDSSGSSGSMKGDGVLPSSGSAWRCPTGPRREAESTLVRCGWAADAGPNMRDRRLVSGLGFAAVIPPMNGICHPWSCNKALCSSRMRSGTHTADSRAFAGSSLVG
jgi:hypothetical protein